MRLIHVFLSMITILSLNACFPASTPPIQITTLAEPIQGTTAAPAIISTPTIPSIEPVFAPPPANSPFTATNTPEEGEISEFVKSPITITIIYDNNPYDLRLNSAWGFSALVEYHDSTLLFDTGGDGQILMENMRLLGIDPSRIDRVVLSHAHEDHTGGLATLLATGVKPVVYLLPSFTISFKRQIEQWTQVSEVSPGQSFMEGIWTTGEMGATIPEQALVIQAEQGLVILTGCAHPGIVAIVEQAKDMFAEPVYLVLGGFHLGSKSESEISAILINFRQLGVQKVAPCHCTGEYAMMRFKVEYGEDFIPIGVGSEINFETMALK
jgi:7,8-dihydropterin-6-yl-methyl-4-(beta-D-ribofuranosyl)aminobenzene 5'-phosphate synthase